MLAKIINEVWQSGTKKLVVFAVFRRTLKYLSIRLKKLGFNALIIHGHIKNRFLMLLSTVIFLSFFSVFLSTQSGDYRLLLFAGIMPIMVITALIISSLLVLECTMAVPVFKVGFGVGL